MNTYPVTEASAMTALCLLDALCDYEHSAGFARGKREAGGTPTQPEQTRADLGERFCDWRSDHGSYEMRYRMLHLAPLVDAAWERLGDDVIDRAGFSFDFEFCPIAVRLWLEAGGDVSDDAFVDQLVAKGLSEAEAQAAEFARRDAEREREKREAQARQHLEAALALLQEAPAK